MGFIVAADLPAPPAVAFALLADPVQRPRWQASLRAVEVLTPGPIGVGTRWYDVTWPGLRPLMEITAWETDRLWTEHGRWRGIEVDLSLRFEARGSGTRVTASARTRATGWRTPARWGLDLLGPVGARIDLRRAGRLL